MITLIDEEKKIRLEEFGFRALNAHSNPSSSKFDRKLQYIPNRFSPWDFGVQHKSKDMSIPCKSLCANEEEFEQSINEFNSFVLDDEKNPKTLKMCYDYEPDKFYYVQLESPFDPNRSTMLKDLTIPFIAIDSNKYADSSAYDPTRKIIYGEVLDDDYYKNTQSFNWEYSTHYSGIYNYSNYKTDLKITITGNFTNASIQHIESGKILTLPNTPYNLFNKNHAIYGQFVNQNNGDLAINADYFAYTYIPINSNIAFYGKNNTERFAFYDANGKFLLGSKTGNRMVPPANSAFLSVCGLIADIDNFQVVEGSFSAISKTVINSQDLTITVNNRTALDQTNSNFFKLNSGKNSFVFSGELTSTAKVEYSWFHRF